MDTNDIHDDQPQRLLALTPHRSFIVQSPAGSGKTTLLTQRYLVLLAHAEKNPEEIVAITFTRKAANEMRQRIMAALYQANQPSNASITSAHHHTHQLAQAVLKRDAQQQWQLLDNPNRLRIQTIDSFCAQLVRQMPTLSYFGSHIAPTDQPETLYRQAIAQLLQQLANPLPAAAPLLRLLKHLDNNLLQVETLLLNMLKRRDQWLPHIIYHKNSLTCRETIEAGLYAITAEQIYRLTQCFPTTYLSELSRLATFAAQQLTRYAPDAMITACLQPPTDDTPLAQRRQYWLGLCHLLFTQSDTLRKTVNKNTGFPPSHSSMSPEENRRRKQLKQAMIDLIQIIKDDKNLIDNLINFRKTPPITYSDQNWPIIDALLQLLPQLVAELRLVFQQQRQVDFIEIAQAAATALGDDETPTDLALALDYQIRHILVDEFQDTSIAQFRLLTRLTAGWQPDEVRTLFLVGDPMQSIYRFRQAEVGLFLHAQRYGIGHIKLEPLKLSRNFRATKPIIAWTNRIFSTLFPAQSDSQQGAVTYSAAIPALNASNAGGVQFHATRNSQQEAEKVVQLVQHAMTDRQATIAILVRARSHLTAITPALNAANLPYQAIEIETLAQQPVIRDLVSLTRALLHLADRIAWLATLRAPWCGVTLVTLQKLTHQTSAKRNTIWECLNDNDRLATLEPCDRHRLQHFRQVMSIALNQRRRLPLHQWVEQTWSALHGDHCLTTLTEQTQATAYFHFLESIDESSDIRSLQTFETLLAQRYTHTSTTDSPLQLLTIHKAKGLEFDHVIVAGLGCRCRNSDPSLLLWHEQPRLFTSESDLILAPLKSSQHVEHDPIYRYLMDQERIKSAHEQQRLLYVAATRAKKQLHLTAHFERTKIEQRPSEETLLASLWPYVNTHFPVTDGNSNSATQSETITAHPSPLDRMIRRLPQSYFHTLPPPPSMTLAHASAPGFSYRTDNQALIGTAVHAILAQIAEDGLEQWPLSRIEASSSHWQQLLITLGMPSHQLKTAVERIMTAIVQTVKDQDGRWLLQHHRQGETEFALTQQGKQFVIDRTFIDEQGQRWIIDYKITERSTTTIQQQITQPKHPWRQQLEQYSALFIALEEPPPRCALYLPLAPLLIEIDSHRQD
jgi:ATP-dependent helicase/nuclease subunit A